MTELKICIDRTLPPAETVEAAERSVSENPANVPAVPRGGGLGMAGPPSPFALAALTGKKWKVGRTLKVRFLGGDERVWNRVARYAGLWSEHANLRFDFGNHDDAHVRIAFTPGGSWAYLGTDALMVAGDQPTVNLGWLDADTPDEEYERVVCHELGHVLGCFHEHQHPAGGIPWDREAVYAYYAGPPNFWSEREVDHNLFRRYSRSFTQYSGFDRDSIMLYPVPEEHTEGGFAVGWNARRSPTDQRFIAVVYPGQVPAPVEIAVGAPPVAAEIGRHGEEDVFYFEISRRGDYVVETTGRTNVVMSLLGPDSEERLIAQDDDSGQGKNARIEQALEPGTYHLRVRHFQPEGTGAYRVGVRPRV